jgi:hypothetical protein
MLNTAVYRYQLQSLIITLAIYYLLLYNMCIYARMKL